MGAVSTVPSIGGGLKENKKLGSFYSGITLRGGYERSAAIAR